MSSLFDQLSATGGAERSSSGNTTNYYHNQRQTTKPTTTSSWDSLKSKYEKEWDDNLKRFRDAPYSQRPQQRPRPRPKQQQTQEQQQTSFSIRSYRETDTTRPYAYEPINNQVGWTRPTWKEVGMDLLWWVAERAIAAIGIAVAEFFMHRRFHPGPGVKW